MAKIFVMTSFALLLSGLLPDCSLNLHHRLGASNSEELEKSLWGGGVPDWGWIEKVLVFWADIA